ncbi:MAG TPA: delta-60 repeat domain-containing protein, partial [Anaerolineae bacterium]|nr:delta-60 repeat domain-containing protein [Anaerolineae bacterium]
MKRNLVVGLCSSFIGLGMVLILLSATGLVAARDAAIRSEAPPAAAAADGDLDATFGSGGKVTTDFNGTDVANSLAIQSDGKPVAGGYASDSGGNSVFALARYTTAGALDGTFGNGGKATTGFDGKDAVLALGIQSNGKIIAAGNTYTGTNDHYNFALARYTITGTLDTTFGSGGKVKTDFNGQLDSANALGIQSDGKIIAAGTAFDAAGTDSDFALARYTVTGTLDTTFGSGGKVTTDIFGSYDTAYALAIQSNGKIVVAGHGLHAVGDPSDFA